MRERARHVVEQIKRAAHKMGLIFFVWPRQIRPIDQFVEILAGPRGIPHSLASKSMELYWRTLLGARISRAC